MSAATVRIALGKKSRTRAAGYLEMTGEAVGQFVIHESHQRFGKWVVTHAPTGYAVAHGPTEERCKLAAEQLMALPVSWKFNRPGKAKEILQGMVRDQIRAIQSECAFGKRP